MVLVFSGDRLAAPAYRMAMPGPSAHGMLTTWPAGNPMKPGFISEPCYNLVYLELAACRLTALPELSRFTPNLRVLNLNYNFLDDVRPLQSLTRLRKLTIIGSRVKAMRDFVRMLRGMLDVEMLDFRYADFRMVAFT